MTENSCWILLYPDTDLRGEALKLEGPKEFTDMKNLPGSDGEDWTYKIKSFKTGPTGEVILHHLSGNAFSTGANHEQRTISDTDGVGKITLTKAKTLSKNVAPY